VPRGAHIDQQATASARLARVLRDRRSFISPEGKVYLYGPDIRRARARVFGRQEGLCCDCGKELCFDETGFGLEMELSHRKPRSLGGDDSDENLCARDRFCHRRADLHGAPGHF
jgi:5-methylcytosine-specific restriction endonuclease McrA